MVLSFHKLAEHELNDAAQYYDREKPPTYGVARTRSSSCRRPGWVWMKLDLQMTLRRDHFITSNVDDIEPLA